MRKGESGFSLIEVMVAMVILTIGVLGLAASSAGITRMTSEGGRSGGSAAVASARFDSLRATTCSSLASGTATTGNYTEAWDVTTSAISGMLREVRLRVTYNHPGGQRTANYETQISCFPKAR